MEAKSMNQGWYKEVHRTTFVGVFGAILHKLKALESF